MAYILPTNAVEALKELHLIRTGNHKVFRGDGVYNVEAVLIRVCTTDFRGASVLAEGFRESASGAAGEDTAMLIHNLRAKQYANTIERCIIANNFT